MSQDNASKPSPELFDITSLDTYILLNLFISILASKAWQHLGLRTAPGSESVEKDLTRASIAIDCIALLINKLENQISAEDLQRQKNLLTDLQINFTRIASAAAPPTDSNETR